MRIAGNGIIAERTAELHRIHAQLFPPPPDPEGSTETRATAGVSDDELIKRARQAKNGDKFNRLWAGR